MSRSGTNGLRRAAEKADCADWDGAARALEAHDAADTVGDVGSLSLWRRVDEGRGTRTRTLARVQAFQDRFPELVTTVMFRLERGLALRAASQLVAAREDLLVAVDGLPRADADRRSLALTALGSTYLSPLDAHRARQAFVAARRVAEAGGLTGRLAEAEVNLGNVQIQTGAISRAAREYRRALQHAEAAGDDRLVVLASYNLGNCLHDLGKNRSARRTLMRAEAIAERRGDRWFSAWSALLLGHLDRKAGAFDAAHARYRQALERFDAPGPTERAWVAFHEGELLVEEGRAREAERTLRAPAADLEAAVPARLACGLALATARAARGRLRPAAALGDRVAHAAEGSGLVEIAWRARVVAARARRESASRAWLDGGALRGTPKDADSVARAMALLEGAMRDLGPLERRLYLRDRTRANDAAWLVSAAATGTTDAARAPDAEARAAWLAALTHLGGMSTMRDVAAALERGLDAILSIVPSDEARIELDSPRGRYACSRDAWGRTRDASLGDAPVMPLAPAGEVTGTLRFAGELTGDEIELGRLLGGLVLSHVAALDLRHELRAETSRRREESARMELELARAETALGAARDRLGETPPLGGMLGRSPVMQELFARVNRVAAGDLTTLVTGESGTGKELVARALHDLGPRRGRPFVAVNCAALPDSLLESELFGHKRGSFTGAERDAPGLFVIADGGTLFLDEIAETSLAMQARLLRVLADGEVRPVGHALPRRVDVRVVAATHRDLGMLVSRGVFREDLLYRLDVLSIRVPPLRARGDDVVVLARHFLSAIAPGKHLSPAATAWLVAQEFPGNVRELRATIEAAAILTDGEVIGRDALEAEGARRSREAQPPRDAPTRLRDLEMWAIRRALASTPTLVGAARSLGVGRATLYRKLDAYRIEAPPVQARLRSAGRARTRRG